MRTGAASETGRGTHAVGQVSNQVVDLDVPHFDLAVQPARVMSDTVCVREEREAHHLVNVFCWTLTHCCSSGAIFSGCGHQRRTKVCRRASRNRRVDMECFLVVAGGGVSVTQTMDAWLPVGLAGARLGCGDPWIEACVALSPCQALVGPNFYTNIRPFTIDS